LYVVYVILVVNLYVEQHIHTLTYAAASFIGYIPFNIEYQFYLKYSILSLWCFHVRWCDL